uniref:Uncharacterized protein n=3 Tax=Sphaerodactylus townsendi TaxID=933632 RepID=A0ACB8FSD6_9SAUR
MALKVRVSEAVNELHELMGKVTSEYHFQEADQRHPTNLTMRNYAKRRNREIQKYSLEKWMSLNKRYGRRFATIPDKFERSLALSR